MTKNELISRISEFRTKANLSARALSIRIGMNEGYINRLETKQDFMPSLEALFNIFEECGTTYEEFFYYKPSEYKSDLHIIELLKHCSQEKKQAIITLLKQ